MHTIRISPSLSCRTHAPRESKENPTQGVCAEERILSDESEQPSFSLESGAPRHRRASQRSHHGRPWLFLDQGWPGMSVRDGSGGGQEGSEVVARSATQMLHAPSRCNLWVKCQERGLTERNRGAWVSRPKLEVCGERRDSNNKRTHGSLTRL